MRVDKNLQQIRRFWNKEFKFFFFFHRHGLLDVNWKREIIRCLVQFTLFLEIVFILEYISYSKKKEKNTLVSIL